MVKKAGLSLVDRFLPLWILGAMAIGLGLGKLFPKLNDLISTYQIDGTSLPIALGLFAMMYPVLAKVQYEELGQLRADKKLLVSSLMLNWLIGPALMFILAWTFLADQPAFRTGLIVIGLARCIAMVLIWNDLACGNREAAALLVSINSIFQIALPLLIYFFIMWGFSYAFGKWVGMEYEKATTLAFTAAGNNFELAIAVSIGVWGVASGQALVGTIGPLIEVPALIGLVYISLWLRKRY